MLYRRPSAIESAIHLKSKKDAFLVEVNNVPSIEWPDGRHCFDASLFLFNLYHYDGLSVFGGGGTLSTYAAYLSVLIRYCYQAKIDFVSISDARFFLFMTKLRTETHLHKGEMKRCRDNNTVIKMGRFYLKFFEFIGELHGLDGMVGKRIRAIQKSGTRKIGDNTVQFKFWYHRSFPNKDEMHHRRALKDQAVDALFSINNKISTNEFIRKRRYVMLLLLKASGCRRLEISMLTTSAITRALKSSSALPILELPNVKQKNNPGVRKIPISRGDLLEVEKYMLARSKIIKNSCGRDHDADSLLINVQTGRGLTPNTITSEFTLLAKAAGLTGQACAQMLRHRYLENLYVELMLDAGTRDKDIFLKLLSSDESLILKLRERSGHASNAGARWYTKRALEKIRNTEAALRNVQAKDVMKGLVVRMETIERDALDRNLSAEAELKLLKEALGLIVADVQALTELNDD